MSYSINVLERYLATVECPVEVRQLVGAIHKYSHANGDALNHDRLVRKSAELLEKLLDSQGAVEHLRALDLPCTCARFANGSKVNPLSKCSGCFKSANQ